MAQEQKIMLPMDVNTRQLMMILNHVYPVGSYYETSDEDFDPNDSFVGEWSLEESGRVHVSAGVGYNIGKKGGEATHTLTQAEMPSHNHGIPVAIAGASGGDRSVIASHQQIRSSESTGGDQPHNNMPPYITVNRWHRNN